MELDGEPVEHPSSGDGGRPSVRTEVFTDEVTERDMGGASFSMHSVQEGTYRQTVRVTVEE